MRRLHPLSVVGAAAALTIAALAVDSLAGLAVLGVLAIALGLLAGARPPLRLLLGLGLVGVVLAGLMAAVDPAAAPRYAARILIVLATVPACACGLAPAELVRALAGWGLPGRVQITTFLALRLTPILLAQWSAQRRARRLAGSPGPLVRNGLATALRARTLPLAAAACDHAEALGLALELRACDPAAGRTSWRSPRWGLADALSLALIAAGLAIAGSLA